MCLLSFPSCAVSEMNSLYDLLIGEMPLSRGKALSCREREEMGEKASTLVYGEIAFDAFCLSLLDVRSRLGRIVIE